MVAMSDFSTFSQMTCWRSESSSSAFSDENAREMKERLEGVGKRRIEVTKRKTHRNAVGVLLADALSFGLALLERMLILELGAHDGGLMMWNYFRSTTLKSMRMLKSQAGIVE